MKPQFLAGNLIQLLETGQEYFPALLACIAEAKDEIHLETYIFQDDETGRAVTAALICARERGVRVRVLVDGFGARGFLEGLGLTLQSEGVQVQVFRPERLQFQFKIHRSRLRRLHRKVVVVDGRVAFVGGINVIDDFEPTDTPEERSPRLDYAVRIEGPLLQPIYASVNHQWRMVRWTTLKKRPAASLLAPVAEHRGKTTAAFVVRDNIRHRRDIERAYLMAISGARKEVLIANAYFLPGLRFRRALVAAAKRGVAVTVLSQGRVEYPLLHFASEALYDELLQAGVRIFEYSRGYVHAKVAVVDGEWATVGSSNIDPISLLMARECNVVIRDKGFAERLRSSLTRAIDDGAKQVSLVKPSEHNLSHRFRRWFAPVAVRLLLGVSGYRGQDY